MHLWIFVELWPQNLPYPPQEEMSVIYENFYEILGEYSVGLRIGPRPYTIFIPLYGKTMSARVARYQLYIRWLQFGYITVFRFEEYYANVITEQNKT